MADLTADLGKIKLKNPVMTASGTFGFGKEYADFFDLKKLGAVVVKGIRMTPCDGNPPPRVTEVSGGMLNAIGLQGPGVEKFLNDEDYMPFLRKNGADVIVNIWGTTIEEYAGVAERLSADSEAICALEINISCPNVKEGGISFGTDTAMLSKVVSAVREKTSLPLITKLSPNVTCIADFAKAAEDSGSDMISLINTIPAMAIDIDTFKPELSNITGGLSGPAIKPVAVKMVFEASNAVKIPVIGMGGIMNADDAVEFIIAGASAVAVGTAIFSNPLAPLEIIDGIEGYLDKRGYKSLSEIKGKLCIN